MPDWSEPAAPSEPTPSFISVPFRLVSPAFHDLGRMPLRHGALGENRSPPLVWSEPPLATRELAILLEERDGVRWLDDAFSFADASPPITRWLGWGLPAEASRLDEGVDPPIVGTTDTGVLGYSGPDEVRTPKSGRALRFSVIALDSVLALHAGATRTAFDEAVAGHVVAVATLLCRYERPRGLLGRLRGDSFL
jgi:hypothetical protein